MHPLMRSVYNAGGNFWLGSRGSKVFLQDIEAKPYLHNTWVYAAARAVSLSLCRLTPELYEQKRKGESITEHAFLDKLHRPNSFMTYTSFRQAIVLALLLKTQKGAGNNASSGGQCFIVPWSSKRDEPVDLRSGEIPDQLLPFNDAFFKPKKVETAPNSGRFDIKGWVFEIPQRPKSRIEFEPYEIIRVYLYNPYSLLEGAAPYIAAQIAVDQDAKSDIYNTRLFENDARVSGVLSTEQKNLTDDVADMYMNRWTENYGGVGNVGKTAILGNGLKYQQIGLTQADMQYTEQKRWNKDQILAAFGLNKIGVGDYEKINYATIREGRKLLWYDTYIPIDKIIWEALNSQWVWYLDGGKYLGRSDYSDVEALQDDRNKQAQAGKDLVQGMQFPPALAARIVGITLKEEDLSLWPHLNEPPTSQPAGGKDSDGDGIIGECVRTLDISDEKAVDRFVDDYVERVLEKGEQEFFSDLRRYFIAQRNAMQDKVDEWLKTQKAVITKSDYVDPKIFMLDEPEQTKKLVKLMQPHAKEQMRRELDKIAEELDKPIDWNVTNDDAVKYVARREKYLRGVNELTFQKARKRVLDKVRQGIENNWTSSFLAKEIKASLSAVAGTRVHQAGTIARTELGTISSQTRFEAFKREGIEKHRWLTHKDERVRLTHQRLNNKVAELNKPFAGSKMYYPRDPRGGAGEVINCRCVTVAVFE